MSRRDDSETGVFLTDAVLALIYALLLIGCTVAVQQAVRGYLDRYEVYVGALVVSFFAFFFAMILGAAGKVLLNLLMGDLYLSRSFVLFACLFSFVACVICHSMLLMWWVTAVMSVVGILITFIKKLVRKKVKHKVDEVREIERDLRHRTMDEARDFRHRSVHGAKKVRDSLRDKYRK